MLLRRRLAFAPMFLVAVAGVSLGPSGITARAATTYTIGVDNATPANHLLMYTDFFPRSGVSVNSGDTIDFKWSTGSPDGFHTTTLLATGETANAVYAATAPVVPDADDGGTTAQENPAVNGPTDPTCGTVGNPCSYGGSRLNSGAFPTAPGKDFYVQMNSTGVVTFLCLIHQGMVGSVTVISPDGVSPSTTGEVAALAAAQYTADTTEALAAAAAVSVPAATSNANGTKTFNAQAGAEAAHEQVLEFFPSSLSVTAGDSVKWTSKAHDIHTVTFPSGPASAADDFHQFKCEATPSTNPDTPASATPPFCTNPADFESHWTPGPAGGTVLANPSTVATSGVIAAAPLPFPDNYTFTVSSAGTYAYQCKVHDHMTGQVLAASVPALPSTGRGPAALSGGKDQQQASPIAALLVISLAVLLLWGFRSTRFIR